MPNFHPEKPFDLPPLLANRLPMSEWESPAVLKKCIEAHKSLAAMNQATKRLPNADVLLSPLVILETQASSAIENIVTTTDNLYRHLEQPQQGSAAEKEALRYHASLYFGAGEIKKRPLSTRLMEALCTKIRGIETTVRKLPSTKLENQQTKQVIYTPPQGEAVLRELLANWERFCHAQDSDAEYGGALDPLVKMAVLHYQFEAIHPFEDGNGRSGRILNLLFLQQAGLLEAPLLYLSRPILRHRDDYYDLLLAVSREATVNAWQAWIIYMLEAVADAAKFSLQKIEAIEDQMRQVRKAVEINLGLNADKTEALVKLIFEKPYCRTENVVVAKIAARQTATAYLRKLTQLIECPDSHPAPWPLLVETKLGRDKIFVNQPFLALLRDEQNTVKKYAIWRSDGQQGTPIFTRYA